VTAVGPLSVLETDAFSQGSRSSGCWVCSVYEYGGNTALESYENCRIDLDTATNVSTFISDGYYETSFEGNAMEDSQIMQETEAYVRRDSEQSWCYESPNSNYAICFAPSFLTEGDGTEQG